MPQRPRDAYSIPPSRPRDLIVADLGGLDDEDDGRHQDRVDLVKLPFIEIRHSSRLLPPKGVPSLEEKLQEELRFYSFKR
jgi:hypothetical protein